MKPAGMSWPRYVCLGLGRRLTELGERWGVGWLTYNPLQFVHFQLQGAPDAGPVAAALCAEFPHARSWADVGCGTGVFAAALRRAGARRVVGCEHSPFGRALARWQSVDCRPFDLTRPTPARLPGGCDVALCFEVAEHLPEALGERLVDFLAGLAPWVVFSAAAPGQGGCGHINEQPKPYWVEKFARRGCALAPGKTASLAAGFRARQVKAFWFAQNALVFATARAGRGLGERGTSGQVT